MPERVEYRPQLCGLKKKVDIAEQPGCWTMATSGPQEEGYCQHAHHAGEMFFAGGSTIGWRCTEDTKTARPFDGAPEEPGWRRVRITNQHALERTNGAKGWEFVTPDGGDA